MDFRIDAATETRLAGLRALGAAEIRPLGLEADRLGRPTPADHPFFQKLVSVGLGRTRWSGGDRDAQEPAKRGSALPVLCLAEELSYWDRGVAVSFPGPGLAEPPILALGSDEQKARFLDRFREPDRPRWGAFAMTEPGAGSDVARIRTSARQDGDHYVLNGDKSFAANASRADFIVVFATVDASLGRDGHRAFVVERDTPGLGDFKIERKMGLKAYESTSFSLRDCRVPAANLLGGGERRRRGDGFQGAMKSFNTTRPTIAAMAVGMGRAVYDAARAFAEEERLLARARVCDRLVRVQRKLRAARLLAWRAAWMADRGRENRVEASMAKAYAPAAAQEAAGLAMDIVGMVGGRGDHLIEKIFRDVKAMDIVEGTGQIQRIVMARQRLGLPREG